jgi:hypothetical protein
VTDIRASAPGEGHDGTVIDDGAEQRDLQALGPAARRAVAAAEEEALALAHDRVGTEHLLLGLLVDERSAAARALSQAGVLLPPARRKVQQALPASPPSRQPGPPLPLTTRAARALAQSVRFSDERRAEAVSTAHLLMGVLHVEGTAGQVLRSLGADVDHLRAALHADGRRRPAEGGSDAGVRPSPVGAPLLCPSCGASISEDIRYRVVRAQGEHGPREATVLACGGCGAVIGAVPS